MSKGTSLNKKHLHTILSTSSFFFFWTIDLCEGYAPTLDLGTKKSDVLKEGESTKPLSLFS